MKARATIMKSCWTRPALSRHKHAMFGSFATLLALAASPAVQAGEVTKIEQRGNALVISFDDVVHQASSLQLSGPDRIAIDISGATASVQRRPGEGMVRAVRQSQFDEVTARVVVDLDQPATIASGNFSADGRQLTLALAQPGTGRAAPARRQFIPPAAFRAEPPRAQYSVRARTPTLRSEVALPPVLGPKDSSLPLVVIDAGHGGHDPGAISPHGGAREKVVTLQLARALRDELLASGRVRVAMTRDSDKFLVLQERYGIARRLDADLFISIHADSAGSHEASGATVYTLSEVASDREAARLAARENKADVINGINLGGAPKDVSSILIDLTQRETMNLSADFAKLVLREGQGKMRFRGDSHRFASFVVLKAPDVPSILLESGYLTSERDVEFLTSASGRTTIARSVARAVNAFFARQLASR